MTVAASALVHYTLSLSLSFSFCLSLSLSLSVSLSLSLTILQTHIHTHTHTHQHTHTHTYIHTHTLQMWQRDTFWGLSKVREIWKESSLVCVCMCVCLCVWEKVYVRESINIFMGRRQGWAREKAGCQGLSLSHTFFLSLSHIFLFSSKNNMPKSSQSSTKNPKTPFGWW